MPLLCDQETEVLVLQRSSVCLRPDSMMWQGMPGFRRACLYPSPLHTEKRLGMVAGALEVGGTYPSVVKLHDGEEYADPEEHAVQPRPHVVDPFIVVRLLQPEEVGRQAFKLNVALDKCCEAV